MTVESREVESPMDSSQYSVISDSSDNQDVPNTAPMPLRIFETVNRNVEATASYVRQVGPRHEIMEQSVSIMKIPESKIVKSDNRLVGIDDEEEIDVEGVDENDPMWRPW